MLSSGLPLGSDEFLCVVFPLASGGFPLGSHWVPIGFRIGVRDQAFHCVVSVPTLRSCSQCSPGWSEGFIVSIVKKAQMQAFRRFVPLLQSFTLYCCPTPRRTDMYTIV